MNGVGAKLSTDDDRPRMQIEAFVRAKRKAFMAYFGTNAREESVDGGGDRERDARQPQLSALGSRLSRSRQERNGRK